MNKWVCPDCGGELKADGMSAWLACPDCKVLWLLDGGGKISLSSRKPYAGGGTRTEGTMLDNERLAEIRARVEAATPGPWVADPPVAKVDNNWNRWTVMHPTDGRLGTWFVASLVPDVDRLQDVEQEHSDAEFIAHARQDVPDLLDTMDVLIQQLATVENLAADILVAAIDGDEQVLKPLRDWICIKEQG